MAVCDSQPVRKLLLCQLTVFAQFLESLSKSILIKSHTHTLRTHADACATRARPGAHNAWIRTTHKLQLCPEKYLPIVEGVIDGAIRLKDED